MHPRFTVFESFRFRYRAWKYRFQTESAEIGALLRQLTPGQIALDIGGHKGAYTYWMRRRVGAGGRVLTFEPQPELATYLRRMVQTYSYGNVQIFDLALSSTAGRATLCRESSRPSPGASLETGDTDKDHRFSVRVDTLDRVLDSEGVNRVGLIKCDAEGHEFEVFLGAEKTLTTTRPPILFECEQRHCQIREISETFRLLESYGYEGFFFRRRKLHPMNDFQQIGASPDHPDYVYNFLFRASNAQAPGGLSGDARRASRAVA